MENYFIELFQNQGLWGAYVIIFILSFLEYVFPPVPADTLLMFAGILAGQGAFEPWSLCWLTVIGSCIGFLCVYWIGLYKGRRYFIKKNFAIFPSERITKLESWLNRHGVKLILINRIFSGFRSLFFLVAGIGKMPLWKVGICGLISSMAWTMFLVWGGYYLGSQLIEYKKYVMRFSMVTVSIISILFVIYLVRHALIKKARKPVSLETECER